MKNGFYITTGENMTEKNVKEAKKKTRVFKVGDLAVYPAHGVGRIESIESKNVGGETHEFYIMKVLENDMVIMISLINFPVLLLIRYGKKRRISNLRYFTF